MPDAIIVDALRTPIGRYAGVLAPVRPDDLAARVLAAAVERNGIDPATVDEVYMGCTNQAGEDNRNIARMASLIAGLPQEIPGATVNRLCASGLEAVVQAGRQIRLGEADLVLAGGVELVALHRCREHAGGQVVGADGREDARVAADRRAQRVDDDGVRHGAGAYTRPAWTSSRHSSCSGRW